MSSKSIGSGFSSSTLTSLTRELTELKKLSKELVAVEKQSSGAKPNNEPVRSDKPAGSRDAFEAPRKDYSSLSQSPEHAYQRVWGDAKGDHSSLDVQTFETGTYSQGNSRWDATTGLYTAEGSAGAEANIFKAHADGHYSGEYGTLNYTADASLGAHASAQGSIDFDSKTGRLNAHGQAEAQAGAEAKAHMTYENGFSKTDADADAFAGARTTASGDIVNDPEDGNEYADLHLNAFAGAQATAKIEEDIGPVGFTAGARAQAGAGVQLNADVGMHNGRLAAQFDLGACWGYGAGVSFGVNVDMRELGQYLTDVTGIPGMDDLMQEAGQSIADMTQGVTTSTADVVHGFVDAGSDISKGDVLGAAGDVAEGLGKSALDFTEGMAKGAADVVEGAGEAIGDAAKTVGNAVGDAASAVGDAISSVFSGW